SSHPAVIIIFFRIPGPVDLVVSIKRLMNVPPNFSFPCGALPLPLGARAAVTARLHTPVSSMQERGAPNPGSEPASARAVSLYAKEPRDSNRTGTLPTPAQPPRRPWAGQDRPSQPLMPRAREDGSLVL